MVCGRCNAANGIQLGIWGWDLWIWDAVDRCIPELGAMASPCQPACPVCCPHPARLAPQCVGLEGNATAFRCRLAVSASTGGAWGLSPVVSGQPGPALESRIIATGARQGIRHLVVPNCDWRGSDLVSLRRQGRRQCQLDNLFGSHESKDKKNTFRKFCHFGGTFLMIEPHLGILESSSQPPSPPFSKQAG